MQEQLLDLYAGLSDEVKSEFLALYLTDNDAAIGRAVELAAQQGLAATTEQIASFINDLAAHESESEDVELGAEALSAVSGGKGSSQPAPPKPSDLMQKPSNLVGNSGIGFRGPGGNLVGSSGLG